MKKRLTKHIKKPRPNTLQFPTRSQMREARSVEPVRNNDEEEAKKHINKKMKEYSYAIQDSAKVPYVEPEKLLKQFRQKDIGK